MTGQPVDAAGRLAVVGLSGGMDSTSLLLHLLARGVTVHGLSFDYGQKHRVELDRLDANLDYLRRNGHRVHHRRLDLSFLGNLLSSALLDDDWQVPEGHYEEQSMKATVVPNRNAIFSSLAYAFALSLAARHDAQVQVGLGVHSGDHAIYPDCRPEFYDALFEAFRRGNWDADRVTLYLPYLHADKYQILRDAQRSIARLGLDFATVFRNTCTSYDPDEAGRSSGRTGADVERILAFHRLGVPDPVRYVRPWEDVLRDALQVEAQRAAAPEPSPRGTSKP